MPVPIAAAMAAQKGGDAAGTVISAAIKELGRPIIGFHKRTVYHGKRKTTERTRDFTVNGWMLVGAGLVAAAAFVVGVWQWRENTVKWKDKDGKDHEFKINLPAAGKGITWGLPGGGSIGWATSPLTGIMPFPVIRWP